MPAPVAPRVVADRIALLDQLACRVREDDPHLEASYPSGWVQVCVSCSRAMRSTWLAEGGSG